MGVTAISGEELDHALERAEADLLLLADGLDLGVREAGMYATAALLLGIRARTLFVGFTRLVLSDVPAAALSLIRPAIEINLTLRFLAKNEDLHTELWVAEGERQAAAQVREIEANHEMLRKAGGDGLIDEAWHEEKREFIATARAKALAVPIQGVGESRSVMPSMWSIAYEHGDQATKEAYTLAYRSLSTAIHTSARGFQHGEFVPTEDGRVAYLELADATREIRRHRALNATTFASTLCALSKPLELGIIADADAIKNVLMSLTTE